jgi:hypothetical protein
LPITRVEYRISYSAKLMCWETHATKWCFCYKM